MTEEEFFRKNYPDFCYGEKPLSPYWDLFEYGAEFGERQSEKKIDDLKANFDYVLEGKEVEYREERKKLCDEFENMKAGLESQIAELKDHLAEEVELHLHAEEYIESLEKEIKELKHNKKTVAHLADCLEEKMKERIADLENQIEKMKCCFNCKHSRTEYEHCRTDKHEKWEIKENG